jgi:hypothetical protein
MVFNAMHKRRLNFKGFREKGKTTTQNSLSLWFSAKSDS